MARGLLTSKTMTLQGASPSSPGLVACVAFCAAMLATPQVARAHRLLLSTGDDVSHCVDRETLSGRVHGALTTTFRGALELRVDIRLEEGAFKLTLVVFDEEGAQLTRRDLVSHSADCRDLDETLVLVSALILDGAVAEVRARVAEAREQRWSVGLSAGGVFGVLPSAYADGSLVVGFRRGRLLAQVRVSLGQAVSTVAIEGQLTLRAVTGSLALCGVVVEAGGLALGPCGNLVVGQLRGATTDLVVENVDVRVPHVRAGGGLGAELSLGRHLRLFASAMLELAVTRTSFSVRQGGLSQEVHRLPWVGGRLELGLMLRLGAVD